MTSLALDWGLYAERREGNFYVPLDRSAGEVRVPSSDGKHHLRVWLDRDAWWVAPGVVVQPWMTKAAYPLRLGEIIAQSFGLGVIERRAVPALERLLAEDRKAIAFRQLLLEALIESRPGCAVCVLAIESLTDWGQEVSDALREVVPASDVLALGAHEQWNGDWLKMNLLFTASEGDAAHVAQVARDAVARRIQPMGRAWPSVSVGVGLPRLESSARAQVSAALDALCAARERGGHRLVTARAGDAPNWAAADLRLRALQDDAIEARDDETRWARYGDALAEVGDGRAPLFAATAQPWPEGELGDTREPRQAMPSEGIGLLEPPELSGKNAVACTWHHGHVVAASFVGHAGGTIHWRSPALRGVRRLRLVNWYNCSFLSDLPWLEVLRLDGSPDAESLVELAAMDLPRLRELHAGGEWLPGLAPHVPQLTALTLDLASVEQVEAALTLALPLPPRTVFAMVHDLPEALRVEAASRGAIRRVFVSPRGPWHGGVGQSSKHARLPPDELPVGRSIGFLRCLACDCPRIEDTFFARRLDDSGYPSSSCATSKVPDARWYANGEFCCRDCGQFTHWGGYEP